MTIRATRALAAHVLACASGVALAAPAAAATNAGDEIFHDGFEAGTAVLFPDAGETGADISVASWLSNDQATRRTAMIYAGGGSGGAGTPVRYGECAAACTNAANWHFATLGSYGSGGLGGSPRLALNGSGHPRVVWYSQAQVGGDGTLYYGECDAADCSSPAAWTIAPLVNFTNGDSMALLARGAFALDPAGHPRILLQDLGNGTFYGQCNSGCTAFANWTFDSFVTITALADLKFTAAGQPRVAFESLAPNVLDGEALYYAACDSNCGAEANWGIVDLIGVDDNLVDHPFALALTGGGAPRIAFYYDQSAAHALAYAWCDTNCSGGGAWTAFTTGLPLYSGRKGVALALDSADTPHLAFGESGDGVDDASADLADCIQGCTSDPIWQWRDIITKDQVPFTPPDPCSTGLSQWQVGTQPDLAIDADGAKRYTFDTYAIFACITGYDDHGNPIYTVDTYAGPVGYSEP